MLKAIITALREHRRLKAENLALLTFVAKLKAKNIRLERQLGRLQNDWLLERESASLRTLAVNHNSSRLDSQKETELPTWENIEFLVGARQ